MNRLIKFLKAKDDKLNRKTSQREIAEALKVSASLVTMWKSGARDLGKKLQQRAIKKYDLPYDFFVMPDEAFKKLLNNE